MTPPRATLHPVILSGGAGTRLWPLSRRDWPKQFLPLAGAQTMLQATAQRVVPGSTERVTFAAPVIVCNRNHGDAVAGQLHAIGVTPDCIVLEPEGRNTAPAVTLAALMLAEHDAHATLLVLPSDHVIPDISAFHAAVATAAVAATKGRLVTFGIPPRAPETGFGYVRRGKPLDGAPGAYSVDRFVEKPDRKTAEKFLASGDYSWNSGMFVLPAGAYLAEVERHAPDVLHACRDALAGGRRDGALFRPGGDAFARAPAISVDHAVMERTEHAAVIAADMGWSDIGSWSALWQVSGRDEDGNVVAGDVACAGTSNSYLRSDGPLIVAVGLDGFAVVASRDAVLVAPMDDVQRVGAVVKGLAEAGRPEAVRPASRETGWGREERLLEEPGMSVSRLNLRPGSRLDAAQPHEGPVHWIVTAGRASVTNGGKTCELAAGAALTIQAGTDCAIEAPADQAVEVIEIRLGASQR